MHAISIHQFGGTEELIYSKQAKPQLNPGEVLVKTTATGVNPIDWKTCSGGGASGFIEEFPFIPGWEFSGVIADPGDTGYKVDDAVFGMIRFPQPAGCYAEYIAAPAAQIARLPDAVDLIMAGGLATASLTAWQALFNKGELQTGQQVLVLGAAGGVGHLAVQLAKWAGAHVTGTASMHNHEFLAELGCERAIDYHTQSLNEYTNSMDLIIDCVGGDTGIGALPCLKPNGVLVTLPSVTKEQVIAAGAAQKRRVEPIFCEPSAEQLSRIAQLVADEDLKLHIGETFPLEKAAEAFELSKSGHVCGKLILTVNGQA
ncbi:Alcohol dehydrogenase GroES-like domain-containing protein [Amphritea atlantica]|jgi:NADPH:quinone reductase-like Zn-dependent oxidoreductase|uniref:Alcohol dehydrogenase GroES-like domain-containing protein n=1 Tax=Amphritea atlantica TaxID=355243 RepID=A0A1H9E4A6_9GAMM|nr:NADP-dependent oxidoreductase [Amphritea atlantica]SEQ20511.1 Alcohol dehydrogenase GroES-like domain-containing protein [Amphritea atlantica]